MQRYCEWPISIKDKKVTVRLLKFLLSVIMNEISHTDIKRKYKRKYTQIHQNNSEEIGNSPI